jgi:hypothetical protein
MNRHCEAASTVRSGLKTETGQAVVELVSEKQAPGPALGTLRAKDGVSTQSLNKKIAAQVWYLGHRKRSAFSVNPPFTLQYTSAHWCGRKMKLESAMRRLQQLVVQEKTEPRRLLGCERCQFRCSAWN